MKAIQYSKFGGIDVLETIDEAKPTILKNQVLVEIQATGINPIDWKIRKGEMKLMSGSKFPKHIGVDFSGVVKEVGIEVQTYKEGDEVFGAVNGMKEGALVEYVAIDAKALWKKPSSMPHAQAASIATVGAAATLVLDKVGKTSKETEILINGATGGLGMFLLQLLRLQEVSITAVANTRGIEYAKKWGADQTIDYTRQNVTELGKTYDVVIDLSGKMGYKNAKLIMKQQSIFINPTPKPINILASPIKNLFTGKKHKVVLSKPSDKNIPLLVNAINDGLQIEMSKTFPFSQFKEAYQFAEKGGYIGKVAIEL